MKFEIFLTKRAEKDLLGLDSTTSSLIKKKLLDYAENPFLHSKKLINATLGEYRFRIGDYRVIADIIENNIYVLRIGHRKDIYK